MRKSQFLITSVNNIRAQSVEWHSAVQNCLYIFICVNDDELHDFTRR
jgi:hypothetical protein